MATYENIYKFSGFGYSGKINFSDATLAYFAPLVDNAKISINNAVTGDNTNYDTPATVAFPVLFTCIASSPCRVRQRVLHPSVNVADTSQIFSRMTGSAGYSNIAAGTDLIRNTTLPIASYPAGTTNLAYRVFNAIDNGNYGMLVPANTLFPIVVSNLRECWLQIIALDAALVTTSGFFSFTSVSDIVIVGY